MTDGGTVTGLDRHHPPLQWSKHTQQRPEREAAPPGPKLDPPGAAEERETSLGRTYLEGAVDIRECILEPRHPETLDSKKRGAGSGTPADSAGNTVASWSKAMSFVTKSAVAMLMIGVALTPANLGARTVLPGAANQGVSTATPVNGAGQLTGKERLGESNCSSPLRSCYGEFCLTR
jgi:hypothetical protein